MSSEASATFLFADLAGFTAMTETHGDEQAAELAAEFCSAVRALLPAHRAEEVKTIGDAILIRSADAAAAVRLGVAIRDRLRERPLFPVVHVGMHTGPAVERDGDWFGSTVNVAARVAGIAGGDEVLLTAETRDAAGDVDGIELEGRGRVELRHVREPVQLFEALRTGAEYERRPIDPVCRMTISPEHCAGHLVHEGATYHFCSLDCAAAFAGEPERYLAQT